MVETKSSSCGGLLLLCSVCLCGVLLAAESVKPSKRFVLAVKAKNRFPPLETSSRISLELEEERKEDSWAYAVVNATADIWQRSTAGADVKKMGLAPHTHAEKGHPLLEHLSGRSISYQIKQGKISLVKDETSENKLCGPVSSILSCVMHAEDQSDSLLGQKVSWKYPIIVDDRDDCLLKLYIFACVENEIRSFSVELRREGEKLPLLSRTVLRNRFGATEISISVKDAIGKRWVAKVESLPREAAGIAYLKDKRLDWPEFGP